jgi:hypothetical protein
LKRRCGGDDESRLVELYSTIVIGVVFPKIASKCSVTNSFIPKRLNTTNQNFTFLDKDINTESSVAMNRDSWHNLSAGSRIVGPCHFVANLKDSAIMCRHCQAVHCLFEGVRGSESSEQPIPYTNETQDDSQIDKKICETQIILK